MALKGLVRRVLSKRAATDLRARVAIIDIAADLLRHGAVEEAMAALGQTLGDVSKADDKSVRQARQLMAVCKRLQRSGLMTEVAPYRELLDWVIDPAGDYGVAPGVWVREKPGATEALLVFTPEDGGFWISIDLLHGYLRDEPWHIVYLRDGIGCFHMAGIDGLAPDYAGCVQALKVLLERLGAKQVYCLGGSAGGYAALRYGLDLDATAVASFSGPTSLVPAHWDDAHRPFLEPLAERAPDMLQDLEPFYRQAAEPPRAILCHGAEHAGDCRAAEHMARAPGAVLMPLPGYDGHDTILYLVATRAMGRIRAWLTGDAPAVGTP